MAHVINKLSIELTCTDEHRAFGIQQNYVQNIQPEMIAMMERCCDQLTDDEQWIQIEKLEINLNTLPESPDGAGQYIKLFGEQFGQELKKQISRASAKNKIQNQQQLHVDLLQYFLITGILPWWADEEDTSLQDLCSNIMDGGNSQPFVNFLLQHAAQGEIWERIALQLNPAFCAFIISRISQLSVAAERLSSQYAAFIDQQQADQPDKPAGNALQGGDKDLMNNFILHQAVEILQPALVKDKDLFPEFLSFVSPGKDIKTLPQKLISASEKGKKINTKAGDMSDSRKEDNQINEIRIEKIPVKHAGVVLLAAFLKPFFTSLTLWKDNEWTSKEALHRAVHLLHYLVSGDERTPEYQLALEKIICGMALSAPIDKNVTLNDTEKKEAADLLTSVITYWTALKNTSVEGLRHSFLERDGILSKKDTSWILRVERKTWDILIDQIPWGFSTVCLPWNDYLIHTEW